MDGWKAYDLDFLGVTRSLVVVDYQCLDLPGMTLNKFLFWGCILLFHWLHNLWQLLLVPNKKNYYWQQLIEKPQSNEEMKEGNDFLLHYPAAR